MIARLPILLWLALFASVAYGQASVSHFTYVHSIPWTIGNSCSVPACNIVTCIDRSLRVDFPRLDIDGLGPVIYGFGCPSWTQYSVINNSFSEVVDCVPGSYLGVPRDCVRGNCEKHFDCTYIFNSSVGGDDYSNSNPNDCAINQTLAQGLFNARKAECEDVGGRFQGQADFEAQGGYCVSATCDDGCKKQAREEYYEILYDCCISNGMEPLIDSTDYTCAYSGNPNSIGMHSPNILLMQRGCSETLLPGQGNNYCKVSDDDYCEENPNDPSCVDCNLNPGDPACFSCLKSPNDPRCKDNDSIPKPPGDSMPPGSSTDSGGGSSTDSGGGGSTDSGGGGSTDSGGGGSTDSGGGGSTDSGGGFYCDRPENANDPLCKNAGYDSYCSDPAHYNEAFCDWSRRCSQDPHADGCSNPQPPPGGGGNPPGGGDNSGGGSSAGSGADSANAISCARLNACDWSKIGPQLEQLGIDKETRDSIKSIVSILKAGQMLTQEQINALNLVASDLDGLRGDVNTGFGGIIDGLKNGFEGVVSAIGELIDKVVALGGSGSGSSSGSGDGFGEYPSICKNEANKHLVICGGPGSGGGGGSGDGGSGSGACEGDDCGGGSGESACFKSAEQANAVRGNFVSACEGCKGAPSYHVNSSSYPGWWCIVGECFGCRSGGAGSCSSEDLSLSEKFYCWLWGDGDGGGGDGGDGPGGGDCEGDDCGEEYHPGDSDTTIAGLAELEKHYADTGSWRGFVDSAHYDIKGALSALYLPAAKIIPAGSCTCADMFSIGAGNSSAILKNLSSECRNFFCGSSSLFGFDPLAALAGFIKILSYVFCLTWALRFFE